MPPARSDPLRPRIVARLAGGRDHVTHLAREIRASRPLLHMHPRQLEATGLIAGTLEPSDDGKAVKYYEGADSSLHLTTPALAEATNAHQAGPGTGSLIKGAPP